jgi:hypothetical protein
LHKIESDSLAVNAGETSGLNLPDTDDEPFLKVALAGRADYLVTGNLADYPPDKRRGCAVVSPAASELLTRERG